MKQENLLLRILKSGYGLIVIGFVIMSVIAVVAQKTGNEIGATKLFLIHAVYWVVGIILIVKKGV